MYNASIEGSFCQLKLNYDPLFVRSPKSFIKFPIVESKGNKLIFRQYENLLGENIKQISRILSLIGLALLFVGSIAYKMIGV